MRKEAVLRMSKLKKKDNKLRRKRIRRVIILCVSMNIERMSKMVRGE